MPTGDALTTAEIAALDGPVPEGAMAVWGEDWSGNPVVRGVSTNRITVLRGEFGKKFDVPGPTATLCHECGALLFVTSSADMSLLQQRHLWDAHGISVSLLP
ncbi:MAG: hypothetical protein WAV90_09735 [Gordonia amarae]